VNIFQSPLSISARIREGLWGSCDGVSGLGIWSGSVRSVLDPTDFSRMEPDMCRIDACERVQIFQESRRKARKVHHCTECGRAIAIGESYRYEAGICEGYLDTHKTCDHCMVARQWLLDNCEGWVYSQVLEEIREHAEEYPKIALGLYKIAIGGARKWKKKHSNDLMPLPKMPRAIELAM
jgi:hypothetical protein